LPRLKNAFALLRSRLIAPDRSAMARSSSPLASQPLARLKCAIERFFPRSAPASMIAVQAAMPSSGAVSLVAQRCHSAESGCAHAADACANSRANARQRTNAIARVCRQSRRRNNGGNAALL